jgi:hypothetical protein
VPAAFFLAALGDLTTLACFAAEPARFAAVRFLAGTRLFATGRFPAVLFFAAGRFFAADRFFATGRFFATVRFFAAALRTGRLLAAALLRAPDRPLLAAVRVDARLAAFFAGIRAALRADDRFTDFLAAAFVLAAMLASAREETGCPR